LKNKYNAITTINEDIEIKEKIIGVYSRKNGERRVKSIRNTIVVNHNNIESTLNISPDLKCAFLFK
jgi:hypothetical protein